MASNTLIRGVAVVAVCAVAGAGAGIAGSMAAPSHKSKTSHSKSRSKNKSQGDGARPARPFGGPPVHAEAVVLNKAGTAYITVTADNGTVKSVSGNDVTIAEGTTAVPYKDVTVTIPSDATIVRNGAKATVGDLKAGDDIHVASSSDGTMVFAHDDTFKPGPGGPGGPGGRGHGPDGDGDGPHGAGGPPPGPGMGI